MEQTMENAKMMLRVDSKTLDSISASNGLEFSTASDGTESLLSGRYTCPDGLTWAEFKVDEFAEQQNGNCWACNSEMSEGFMCMDGGEELCLDCVELWISPGENLPPFEIQKT